MESSTEHLQTTPPPSKDTGDKDKEDTDKEDTKEKSEAQLRATMRESEGEMREKRHEYLKTVNPELPGMVAGWKKKYSRIESVHILGQLYIYRGLMRSEYVAIMGPGMDRFSNDESTAAKGLLWPPIEKLAWVSMPAGIPATLSELILVASGFGAEDPIPVRL